jgi:hypothetical protein
MMAEIRKRVVVIFHWSRFRRILFLTGGKQFSAFRAKPISSTGAGQNELAASLQQSALGVEREGHWQNQ